MKIKRLLGLALAILMALAAIPAAALAEAAEYELREAAGMKRWDDVWAILDPVEAEMLASGATRAEVTYAVYKAALNCPLIDEGSIVDLTDNEFSFTTNGMWGGYNYRVRNYDKAPARQTVRSSVDRAVQSVNSAKGNGPTSGAVDILLVGPYYGQDSSFTDQYKEEALSLAAVTGGTSTLLSGTAATGPAIAQNYPNKAVVIYDSHGNCINSKQTSYLDLTTSSGLTTSDYSNGWAYNGGSFWGIDGRYIQNHVSAQLTNTFVWMAICEGMKSGGRGTTGTALLAAGASAVYGYSQSVTFGGDYLYEEVFWNEMKNGATVKDALAYMKYVHGVPDPYGNAYPILMSPVDPFPSNPDGEQDPNCDWTLWPEVDLLSFSLPASVNIYNGFSKTVEIERVPVNANNFTVTWTTADPSVATTLDLFGKALVSGRSVGSTTLTGTVSKNGQTFGTVSCTVNVLALPSFEEVINEEGGSLPFTSATANYPWKVGVLDDEPVAMSGNATVGNSTSTLQLVLTMEAGEKLVFDWRCSSEEEYDYYRFYVNNSEVAALTGETDWLHREFTASSAGTYTFKWSFIKDPYEDGVTDAGYIREAAYIRNYILGDVNLDGEVTAEDALLALRYTMELQNLDPTGRRAGDMNGDGVINAEDALLIFRICMGL